MTLHQNQGFTLIELLVVVLIVGILSAVALPQYEKAVEKSRAAEAFSLLKSMNEAHQLYGLQNGTTVSAPGMDELDITIPGEPVSGNARARKTRSFFYRIGGAVDSIYVNTAARLNPDGTTAGTYSMFTTNGEGMMCCWHASKYESLCQTLGFTYRRATSWHVGSLGCLGTQADR